MVPSMSGSTRSLKAEMKLNVSLGIYLNSSSRYRSPDVLETQGVLAGGFLVPGFEIGHGFGAQLTLLLLLPSLAFALRFLESSQLLLVLTACFFLFAFVI